MQDTIAKPIIEVNNLSIHFQSENEVNIGTSNISFSINKNETLAIVGESGSGKSISALSIMGLLPMPPGIIHSGEILFDEKDLAKIEKSDWSTIRGNKIGMIFQEPMTSLNPLKKCGEQVMEAIQLHQKNNKADAYEQTIKLFEEVRLPEPEKLFEKYPHEISGGQKQRVMIAMAICCEPKLLIADEPTTALDVSVQRTILDLLKELQKKYGMAILFITHDLAMVQHFADNVLVMQKGEMVEQGDTQTIFNDATEAYTKGLINCRPNVNERVTYLKQVEDFIEEKNVDPQPISPQAFETRLADIAKNENILEIKNLNTWYPLKQNFFGKTTHWFEALNDVNLIVKKGETLGILGESGCGKTTLGKTIIGLTDITSGDILYKGQSIKSIAKQEKLAYQKEVQIIFQDPYSSLNPRIAIGDAIKEPMDVHKLHNKNERKAKAIELLEKVGLKAEHYKRYPHEFSGGQRQRICIARALAVEPELIICDESVSALDVSVQAQVLNLLVELRKEFNLTYLFISHDIGVVKHISDRIAVMNAGSVVEYNNAESLYNSPINDYTKIDSVQKSV